MDTPHVPTPVSLPRQRQPGGPLAPSRIFVASPAGTVAAWVMSGSAPAPRRVPPAPLATALAAATTAHAPPTRRAPRRRHDRVVPPGRHAQTSLAPGWSLARDALLVLLALAVLVLAVVAVQQPA